MSEGSQEDRFFSLPKTPEEAAKELLPADSVEFVQIDRGWALVARKVKMGGDLAELLHIPQAARKKACFDLVHLATDELISRVGPEYFEDFYVHGPYTEYGVTPDEVSQMLRLKPSVAHPEKSVQAAKMELIMTDFFHKYKRARKDFIKAVASSRKPFLLVIGHGSSGLSGGWEIGEKDNINRTVLVGKLLRFLNPNKYSAVLLYACNPEKQILSKRWKTPVFYAVGDVEPFTNLFGSKSVVQEL